MRVSKALHAIGEKLQCLSFLPTENLHNIVQFQMVITRWCSATMKKLPNIRCFTYVFPCDFAKKKNEVVSLSYPVPTPLASGSCRDLRDWRDDPSEHEGPSALPARPSTARACGPPARRQ
jgi:hypothetical protein